MAVLLTSYYFHFFKLSFFHWAISYYIDLVFTLFYHVALEYDLWCSNCFFTSVCKYMFFKSKKAYLNYLTKSIYNLCPSLFYLDSMYIDIYVPGDCIFCNV